MFALIILECRWAICIYHGRNVDFSKFIFPIYMQTTQLGIIRRGKKECRFITGTTRGKGGGKGPCSVSDGERAHHLIDCARPRKRERQL